jgi:serine/threonine protein kinase
MSDEFKKFMDRCLEEEPQNRADSNELINIEEQFNNIINKIHLLNDSEIFRCKLCFISQLFKTYPNDYIIWIDLLKALIK